MRSPARSLAAFVVLVVPLLPAACDAALPESAAADGRPAATTTAATTPAATTTAATNAPAAPARTTDGATAREAPARRVDDVVDVLPPIADPREVLPRAFYPIGFSPAGAFAAITSEVADGRGGVEWRFFVVDLDDDRVLASVVHHDERADAKPSDLAAFLSARRAEVERALAAHGVVVDAPRALSPAAFSRDGTAYEARARRGAARTAAEFPKERVAWDVVVEKRGAGEKKIGAVEAQRQDGVDYFFAPMIQGVLVSPREPRAAVVVAQPTRGFEGPPNGTRFVVLGARLDARFAPGDGGTR